MIRSLDPGAMVGPWKVVGPLGGGSGGEVYEVIDDRGRRAALKWVPAHSPSRRTLEAMLRDEARLGELLAHPSIVAAHGLLPAPGGTVALLLELVEGPTLGELIDRADVPPLPAELVARVLADVCGAVDHAHRCCDESGAHLGVVHRDLSPDNVLLSAEGVAKVGDFGIAAGEGRHQETISGVVKGRLGYLAPEQAGGGAVGHWTDIYALGLILAEASIGARLVTDLPLSARLDRARRADVDPQGLLSALPAELTRVVSRAAALRPEDRHPSAAHLARELAEVGPPPAPPEALAAWIAALPSQTQPGTLDALLEDLGVTEDS